MSFVGCNDRLGGGRTDFKDCRRCLGRRQGEQCQAMRCSDLHSCFACLRDCRISSSRDVGGRERPQPNKCDQPATVAQLKRRKVPKGWVSDRRWRTIKCTGEVKAKLNSRADRRVSYPERLLLIRRNRLRAKLDYGNCDTKRQDCAVTLWVCQMPLGNMPVGVSSIWISPNPLVGAGPLTLTCGMQRNLGFGAEQASGNVGLIALNPAFPYSRPWPIL